MEQVNSHGAGSLSKSANPNKAQYAILINNVVDGSSKYFPKVPKDKTPTKDTINNVNVPIKHSDKTEVDAADTPLLRFGARPNNGITRHHVFSFCAGVGLTAAVLGTLLALKYTSNNESSCPALVDDGSILANYTGTLANLLTETLYRRTSVLVNIDYPPVPPGVKPVVDASLKKIEEDLILMINELFPLMQNILFA